MIFCCMMVTSGADFGRDLERGSRIIISRGEILR
jgi:hypothetical protein